MEPCSQRRGAQKTQMTCRTFCTPGRERGRYLHTMELPYLSLQISRQWNHFYFGRNGGLKNDMS